MSDLPSIADLLKKVPQATSVKTDSVLVSKEQDEPVNIIETTQSKFDDKMHDVRLKEMEAQAESEATSTGLPYINLKGFAIIAEALLLIPEEQARALQIIPFFFSGSEIRFGAMHPEDQKVKDVSYQIGERNKAHGELYKISEESLKIGLDAYKRLPKVRKIIKGVKITDEELEEYQSAINTYAEIQTAIDGASISDVMTIIMAASLKFDTSDVHIEAEEKKIAVRYRIDGMLQEVAFLPADAWKKVISRIKLISGLKINITSKPQDGRFTIFLKTGDTDVRVSTIPTAWGESVVMRLLKPGSIQVEFSQLGYRPIIEKKLINEIKKPHGMIITTGPTGSGKTTTLYAMLRDLNTPDKKIVTLEDPIEYKLAGINQSQINHSKDYTFAGGLRSILRQDPDVVMVGEIRDLETADVAINAALTGHLLLSTIHTNSASGAIPRFIAMGVKPFLLSPALNAIMGQRLARRIHEDCKETYTPDPELIKTAQEQFAAMSPTSGETAPDLSTVTFYKGKGCEVCNNTGYKGRVGLYEIIIVDDIVRKALSESVSEYEIKQIAIQQGMVTMTQDGLLKAVDGVTTMEEVIRITGGE